MRAWFLVDFNIPGGKGLGYHQHYILLQKLINTADIAHLSNNLFFPLYKEILLFYVFLFEQILTAYIATNFSKFNDVSLEIANFSNNC